VAPQPGFDVRQNVLLPHNYAQVCFIVPSVADPGCLSRILIFVHLASRKKFVATFFVATNITKLKIILFLNWFRKKFGPIYKEL
jgi:hypothetical protein